MRRIDIVMAWAWVAVGVIGLCRGELSLTLIISAAAAWVLNHHYRRP